MVIALGRVQGLGAVGGRVGGTNFYFTKHYGSKGTILVALPGGGGRYIVY